jgi:DNA-binding CsgD family transcriptional regulator
MWAEVRIARDGVLAEIRDPSPGPWFADAVMGAVSRAVGFDGYCLFGVDPQTRLRSVMFSRNGLLASTERLVYNETVESDLNRYADLATRRQKTGVLSAQRAAEPPSPRLHEMLRPQGFSSELRAALVSNGRYWGALSLFRDGVHRPFTESDAEIVDEIVGPLSTAIRRYQIGRPGGPPVARADGVAIFDESGRVVDVSDGAHSWLAALAESWPGGASAHDLDRVVVEVARAAESGDGRAVCRARMPGGGWLAISASRVEADGVGTVATLRAGDPGTVMPAFAALCGLTHRETAVLGQLVGGSAAKQIAKALRLSVLTVNDHVVAIYRKAGVRSRSELVSLLS